MGRAGGGVRLRPWTGAGSTAGPGRAGPEVLEPTVKPLDWDDLVLLQVGCSHPELQSFNTRVHGQVEVKGHSKILPT